MNFVYHFGYFINNKKKVIMLFVPAFISIILLYNLQLQMSTFEKELFSATVSPREYFSEVESTLGILPLEIRQKVESHETVEKMVPCHFYSLTIRMNFLGNNSTLFCGMEKEDILRVLDALEVHLIQGRFPENQMNEAILQREVAEKLHLKVGDTINNFRFKADMLPADFRVVGIIDSPILVSFCTPHDYNRMQLLQSNLMVFPKKGMMAKMNQFLESIQDGEVVMADASVMEEFYHQSIDEIRVICLIVNLLVFGIATFSISCLSYVFYFQRGREFSILYAVGFTRQQLVKRALGEISIIQGSSFFLGIVSSILFIACVFPKAQALSVTAFMVSCSIPLFSIIFSTFTIWKNLLKLDMIAVIEGGA